MPAAEDRQGVTDTSIVVGAVSPITGPVAFPGGTETPSAYFKMLNDKGGINGRKFKYIAYTDDSTDTQKGLAACRRLNEVDKSFASVGGAQIFSAAACYPYYAQHGVPAVGDWSAHTANYTSPIAFVAGVYPGAQCKSGADWAYKNEFKAKKWSFFWVNSYLSTDCKVGAETAVKKNGGENVFQSFQPFGYPDYTGEAVRAKSAGAEAIFCSCDPPTGARVYQAAVRQGWKVPIMGTHHTFANILYQTLKADSNAFRFANQGMPAYDETDNPQVALMRQALSKYAGSVPPDSAMVPTWFGTRIFQLGLEAMGKDVSRTRLLGWLAAQDKLDVGSGVPLDFRKQTAIPNFYRIPNKMANISRLQDGKEVKQSDYFPGLNGNNPDPQS